MGAKHVTSISETSIIQNCDLCTSNDEHGVQIGPAFMPIFISTAGVSVERELQEELPLCMFFRLFIGSF